jgi:AcrR family transcriptional regulator
MKPARILRASYDNHHKRPEQSAREQAREERILAGAQTVFAENGRHEVTLTSMALALHVVRSTLRHHFCDLDALLAAILNRHLVYLARIIGDAAHYDDPDAFRKRRAAYLAATRTILGGLTEAHLLLVRDRHLLPEDLLPHIEGFRNDIAHLVAGPDGRKILALLDSPEWTPDDIEALLAPHQPQPAQPPALAETPTPPSRPKFTEAEKDQIRARWPHFAADPEPGAPPDDLTRFGQPHRPRTPNRSPGY